MKIISYRASATRQIPLRFQSQADAYVKKLIDQGIITEPTPWCCHAFFILKPNGKIRLVMDFSPLNKYIKRPVHPFPSTKDILLSMPATAKGFASLDAVNESFQVSLDEES